MADLVLAVLHAPDFKQYFYVCVSRGRFEMQILMGSLANVLERKREIFRPYPSSFYEETRTSLYLRDFYGLDSLLKIADRDPKKIHFTDDSLLQSTEHNFPSGIPRKLFSQCKSVRKVLDDRLGPALEKY
jgi:hypothetical protein